MALTVAAMGSVAAAQDAADVKPRPVLAPHYGDTLFHFFQDKYFSAITGLMVSQHFERLSPHDDDAEILRGGLLLSYGMHQEAGRIFARLIERGAPPSVRDRAWYYLARIRWQRGLADEALEAIAKVQGTLPAPLEDDRGLLHANLLMARKDFAGAAARLRAIDAAARGGVPTTAARIVRHNLGVALIGAGDVAAGSALLDEVGRAPAADEEQRALRDRANVALGFAALQDGRADDARAVLQRVRLQGLHANRALLGFGWAAAQARQPERALAPWTELAGRTLGDAAVLEARLALPYAYAELGAYGQSLEGYERAVAQFDTEQAALKESIDAIRSGRLVEALAAKNPGEEMGWFWSLAELPDALPHPGHLTQVLAQHEFQEAFKNWRDLQFVGRNLQTWRDQLAAYRDMLAERRAAFARRLPATRSGASDRAAQLQTLQQRRDALSAAFERAERDGDAAAFANARQADLLQRLAHAQATLKAQAADPDVAALADKVRLLAGALAWQLAQDAPGRQWEARKALRDTDEQLAQAARRDAALAAAQRDEPARLDAFGRRIDALEARLDALIPRVAALSAEQQQAVQGLAVAELERARVRLAEYQTQARFALAQLYDRARVASHTPEASPDAPRR